MDLTKGYRKIAEEKVSKMTLEEKASFCSGKSFWNTKSLERLEIPSILMTDGPHGIRKQDDKADHLGINKSIPSTCFPTAVTVASSFDNELMYEMGTLIADEAIENEVSVVLGPGVNIKRNPLCGRNFEYFSEDPYLSGSLGKYFINGVESKNVGVSVKHYLANSQEFSRFTSDSIVDDRTLREIYMPAFETIVKEAKPATIMCSYNKINGIQASEHKFFMTEILKKEWGFDGLIVTDWGATNDRVCGVRAGVDLQMPPNNGVSDGEIVQAVRNGDLDEKLVDECAKRAVSLALATANNKKISFDREKHNELARKFARESAVLLENNGILPLKSDTDIAVIGKFAKEPRYQGAGSSKIESIKVTSFCEELDNQNISFNYAEGYNEDGSDNTKLLDEAKKLAEKAETVICFLGLPNAYESEGFDRNHMDLPQNQNTLIKELLEVNKNIVVVLHLGSPVHLPFRKDVKAILNMYLGGQNVGGATYDLIYGLYSPCGKLAETFPENYEDVGNKEWFSKNSRVVPYKESIYVGYRYFDKFNVKVAYPFGYGLSYSKFAYSDIEIDEKTKIVSANITNIGNMVAKEIAELYILPPKSKIFKAKKELKGYAKIELLPNETKKVEFKLDDRSFAFWNVNINDWQVENGAYKIEICSNYEKVELTCEINLSGYEEAEVPDYSKTASVYYEGEKLSVSDLAFESILGRKVPSDEISLPFTFNSTLEDLKGTKSGEELALNVVENLKKRKMSEEFIMIIMSSMQQTPLRMVSMTSGGAISKQDLVEVLNSANNEKNQ